MTTYSLSKKIRNLANSTGIDVVGFADASEFSGYRLNQHQRRNPKLTLPDAKSIIVAGIYIGGVTLPEWKNAWYGRTSRLYLSGFFLDVVRPLVPVADFLKAEGYRAIICNGTAEDGSILPLKLSAIRAGLGWQGKHSLLISKKYGTFLALGGIITDAELDPAATQEKNRCRKCTICQDVCPVSALEQPHVLDTDKCISNRLSEENLPEEVAAVMENRIGDCEICQDACPWNQKHIHSPLKTKMTAYFQKKIRAWGKTFYLPHLADMSPQDYRDTFGHLKTGIPYELFHRNVLIALDKVRKTSATETR